MSRRDFLWWVAPPLVGLLVALGGELYAPLADLGLLTGLVVPVWALALLVKLPLRAIRRQPVAPLLHGVWLLLLCFYVQLDVIFGVPSWTKRNAQPAIEALASWREKRGSYPPGDSWDPAFPVELAAALRETGCFYTPDGAGYQLTCAGVAFAHCVYQSATGAWIAFS